MAAPTLDLLRQRLGAKIAEAGLSHGTLALLCSPPALCEVVEALRSEFDFDLLLDVTAVDWPRRDPRFDVVYHCYSTQHFVRVRIKTRVAESDPVVDSLTPLYGSAHFLERECHEMYGIVFRGNGDLRPLLLYEGFIGHPLRKDYPIEREQPLVPYRQ